MSEEEIKPVYRCEFDLKGSHHIVKSSRGIYEFKDGFWLDNKLNMTTGLDCLTWIPPGKIVCIVKES